MIIYRYLRIEIIKFGRGRLYEGCRGKKIIEYVIVMKWILFLINIVIYLLLLDLYISDDKGL